MLSVSGGLSLISVCRLPERCALPAPLCVGRSPGSPPLAGKSARSTRIILFFLSSAKPPPPLSEQSLCAPPEV